LITDIESSKCTGCGTCVSHCNMDVLRLSKAGKSYIAYNEDCMTCFECALNCPEQAISVSFSPGFVTPSIKDSQNEVADNND
jgi:NAD-dependent dihydropyrimidine dehydrogenase PreA subunit